MVLPHKPDPELLPMHRPRCPHCQTRMITTAIESEAEGFERRSFECRKCAYAETATVASDPIEIRGAGGTERLADELQLPH